MSLSSAAVTPPSLSDTETDSQVPRPGPEGGRVGEGYFQVMAVEREIRRPDRLVGREREREVMLQTVHYACHTTQRLFTGD